jgi:hypothetical protein
MKTTPGIRQYPNLVATLLGKDGFEATEEGVYLQASEDFDAIEASLSAAAGSQAQLMRCAYLKMKHMQSLNAICSNKLCHASLEKTGTVEKHNLARADAPLADNVRITAALHLTTGDHIRSATTHRGMYPTVPKKSVALRHENRKAGLNDSTQINLQHTLNIITHGSFSKSYRTCKQPWKLLSRAP